MAVKETIAFVGEPTPEFTLLARHLGKKEYRLLVVTEKDESFIECAEQRLRAEFPATVETIDCVTDGCWEADIVILLEAKTLEKGLLEKIREVATQKIVVYLMGSKNDLAAAENHINRLRNILPNSKVLGLLYESESNKLVISGDDNEAAAFIATLVEDLASTTFEHSQQ